MELELRVISAERHILGQNATKVFGTIGGLIGRAEQCEWCLPDPRRHISGQHASISFEDGCFYITDLSTNGTYINQQTDSIAKGVPCPLKDGDLISLGDFQLEVRIYPDGRPASVRSEECDDSNTVISTESEDPLLCYQQHNPSPKAGARPRSLLESGKPSGLESPFMPPEIMPETVDHDQSLKISKVAAPVHLNPRGGSDQGKSQTQTNPPVLTAIVQPETAVDNKPARESGVDNDSKKLLEAFCRGMGVAPSVFDKVDAEAVLEMAGRSLSDCVNGMVAVMKQRAKMKNEFRIDMTYVKNQNNNPLKFSANRQQALRHLFRPEKGAFLSLDESFAECFDDILAHQLGVMSGAQQALEKIMARFNPSLLERRWEESKARGISVSGKRARYWEAFKELYRELDSEDDLFNRLFGDAFIKGYEQSIDQIKKSKTQ